MIYALIPSSTVSPLSLFIISNFVYSYVQRFCTGVKFCSENSVLSSYYPRELLPCKKKKMSTATSLIFSLSFLVASSSAMWYRRYYTLSSCLQRYTAVFWTIRDVLIPSDLGGLNRHTLTFLRLLYSSSYNMQAMAAEPVPRSIPTIATTKRRSESPGVSLSIKVSNALRLTIIRTNRILVGIFEGDLQSASASVSRSLTKTCEGCS